VRDDGRTPQTPGAHGGRQNSTPVCHLSTLARRLTTILPAMTLAEAIETTCIHRAACRTGGRTALVTTRSCRAPHHTISDAGLIGGAQVPMPGELSLAHHGVLFLDARPEFRRHVLEVLRQPLEEGMLWLQSRGCPRSLHTGRPRRGRSDAQTPVSTEEVHVASTHLASGRGRGWTEGPRAAHGGRPGQPLGRCGRR
jgi:Magnesium chelatase, subunit ChlI